MVGRSVLLTRLIYPSVNPCVNPHPCDPDHKTVPGNAHQLSICILSPNVFVYAVAGNGYGLRETGSAFSYTGSLEANMVDALGSVGGECCSPGRFGVLWGFAGGSGVVGGWRCWEAGRMAHRASGRETRRQDRDEGRAEG